MSSAFNPPPAAPTSSAAHAAAAMGRCQSRCAAPNTTAEVRKAYIVQYAPSGAVAYRPQPDGSRGPAEPQDNDGLQFPVVKAGQLVPAQSA